MTKEERAAQVQSCIDYLRTVVPQGARLYFLLSHTQGQKTYYHRVFVVAQAHGDTRLVEVTAAIGEVVAPIYKYATGSGDKFGIKADVDAVSNITAKVARALYPDFIEHAQSGYMRLPIYSERL